MNVRLGLPKFLRKREAPVPTGDGSLRDFAISKYREFGILDLWDDQEEVHFATAQKRFAREALDRLGSGTDGKA